MTGPDVQLEEAAPKRDLIFDFGLHHGHDARFYLAKGFHVVGLEAAPNLCRSAGQKLEAFGERLIIVNKALSETAGQRVSFFTVPSKDDWGSLTRRTAEKSIHQSVEILVETTDLAELFETYGVPYYIKCDLEGADVVFTEQLLKQRRRPIFVSVEINNAEQFDALRASGYDCAQIVNQFMHPFTRAPEPAREGTFDDAKFTGETSGLFGLELPPEKWRPIEEVKQLYRDWKSIKTRDPKLAPGWVDVHCCHQSTLEPRD